MQRMSPISYGTQQVERPFFMAYIFTSGPVLLYLLHEYLPWLQERRKYRRDQTVDML